MEQELIIQANFLEQQARELEGNLQIIDNQISELGQFLKDLDFLMNIKNEEILASVGKGVYIKAGMKKIERLFVEVGAGVVVQKSPKDTIEVIKNQIPRLKEARFQINAQLEIYREKLGEILDNVRAGQ